MDRQELTDIVINSAIGARNGSFLTEFVLKNVKHAKRLTDDKAQEKYDNLADDYIRLLDNYYVHSEKDASIEGNQYYLRGVQHHLVYIHDIEVEGVVNKNFFWTIKRLREYSSYGSILTLTFPFSLWTGAVGAISGLIYLSARRVEKAANKFLAELKAAADEAAPKRDALKTAELSEFHEVLQESKERVNAILHPPENEKPLFRRKRRKYHGSASGYNPYRTPGWF